MVNKMKYNGLFKKSVCILMASAMLAGFAGCSKDSANSGETTTSTAPSAANTVSNTQSTQANLPAREGELNPLTGLYGMDASAKGKRPFAVVVENSPAARPQWGISTPDILVEGLTEGGITRMLLLYSDVNKIPKIGPLRSARHDFVEISQCFDSIFVHCGWSIYAEEKIKSEGVNNLNGIMGYSPNFFYRDSSRKSKGLEHTGYTNGSYISATLAALKYRTDVKQDHAKVFSFYDETNVVKPTAGVCNSVDFTFSSSYKHSFKYDSSKGVYLDYFNGKPREDDTGAHLSYKNILVLYTPIKSMGDAKGCIDMGLESSNTGYYISANGYEKVTWTKTGSAANSQLVVKNSAGEKITMNAGTTYIGLVPTSQESATVIS